MRRDSYHVLDLFFEHPSKVVLVADAMNLHGRIDGASAFNKRLRLCSLLSLRLHEIMHRVLGPSDARVDDNCLILAIRALDFFVNQDNVLFRMPQHFPGDLDFKGHVHLFKEGELVPQEGVRDFMNNFVELILQNFSLLPQSLCINYILL